MQHDEQIKTPITNNFIFHAAAIVQQVRCLTCTMQ